MFRKKFVGLLSLFLAIFLLINFFAVNFLVKSVLVNGLQLAVGAKVTVDKVNVSLLEGRAELSNIEVGDKENPFKNLIEIDRAYFKLDNLGLFKGIVHLEEGSLNGIKFNTKRNTSTSLDKDNVPDSAKKKSDTPKDTADKGKERSDAKARKDIKLEDFVDVNSLQTVSKLNDAIRRSKKLKEELKKSSSGEINKQIKDLNKKWTDITNNPPKNFLEYPNYLKKIDKLINDFQDVNKILDKEKDLFSKKVKELNDYVKAIRDSSEKELVEIIGKIDLTQYSQDELIEKILGEKYYKYRKNIKKLLYVSSKLKPKKKEKKEKETWGQNIEFPGKDSLPKFIVEKIELSGLWEGNVFKGDLFEMVSNQSVRNKPTTFKIYTIPKGKVLKSTITGIVDFRKGSSIALSLQQPMIKVEKDNILYSVLSNESYLKMDVKLVNGIFSMNSNLDKLAAKAMNSYYQDQTETMKQQIKKEWNDKINSKISEYINGNESIQNSVSSYYKNIEKEINKKREELNHAGKKFF